MFSWNWMSHNCEFTCSRRQLGIGWARDKVELFVERVVLFHVSYGMTQFTEAHSRIKLVHAELNHEIYVHFLTLKSCTLKLCKLKDELRRNRPIICRVIEETRHYTSALTALLSWCIKHFTRYFESINITKLQLTISLSHNLTVHLKREYTYQFTWSREAKLNRCTTTHRNSEPLN
jgi:hypothetical protein